MGTVGDMAQTEPILGFWAAKKKLKMTNWVCPAPFFYSKNPGVGRFVARKEGAILQFQLTWLTWPVCRIVSRLGKLHLDQVFLLGVMVDQNPEKQATLW